jgi:phage gp16-like protein
MCYNTLKSLQKDNLMQVQSTVTIPNVQLTLDELIGVVRTLNPEARSKMAQALITDDMDERFARLIQRLTDKTPVTDISNAEINEEIRAVRRQRH